MFFVFFEYLVEARVRANTTHSKGGLRRGAGVGRIKQWGTETLGDLWKGEGWGGEHGQGTQDGYHRDF